MRRHSIHTRSPKSRQSNLLLEALQGALDVAEVLHAMAEAMNNGEITEFDGMEFMMEYTQSYPTIVTMLKDSGEVPVQDFETAHEDPAVQAAIDKLMGEKAFNLANMRKDYAATLVFMARQYAQGLYKEPSTDNLNYAGLHVILEILGIEQFTDGTYEMLGVVKEDFDKAHKTHALHTVYLQHLLSSKEYPPMFQFPYAENGPGHPGLTATFATAATRLNNTTARIARETGLTEEEIRTYVHERVASYVKEKEIQGPGGYQLAR